jgi:peptidyl-prolyl cis-trans isomerase B (cyclophilin B)
MKWLLPLFLVANLNAQDETKPKDPLTLTATVEVKLENTGDRDLEVTELQFEKRSVSFDIKIPGAAGRGPREFTYAVIRPDPHVQTRLPLPRFTLAKGKSVVTQFRIPTLKVGEMEIAVRYAGSEKELKTAAVKINVKPTSQGGKLAAILDTEKGLVTIELLPDEAPANVMNFIALARSGFYDRMIFHRVIKSSWVQTGCPYGLGIGGPGYAIASEAKNSEGKPQETKHGKGTVSMAGYEKADFNGSQFFLCLGTIPALDGKFTVIGKVDEASLKILEDLGKVDTDKNTDRPKDDLDLKKVTIVVK